MFIIGAPGFVAAAAVNEVETVAAAMSAVQTSYPMDATASANVARQVQVIVNAAAIMLDPAGADAADIATFATNVGLSTPPPDGITAIAQAIVTTMQALGAGMTPAVAKDAMASLVATFNTAIYEPPYLSANADAAAQNIVGVQQMARLAALTTWAQAVIGNTYTDRPQGVTARGEAAERFEIELNNCKGQDYAALYVTLEALQGQVVAYLTQLINNLAPVIEITARISMPSLYWAWRLYQDPTRAVDLTLRNEISHPSFFPRDFTALAPGYAAPGLSSAWPAPPL